jgi:hypothetical protein
LVVFVSERMSGREWGEFVALELAQGEFDFEFVRWERIAAIERVGRELE